MSAHRYWGIYLTAKSGYSFGSSVGTLQIKEIELYYTDSYGVLQNALTTDLSVIATTTTDLNDVYPFGDNPLDINDPWYNGLTPINPSAVNDNSLSNYCTFPDAAGTFIPDGALLVDFGTFEVRDISSVRIFYGDISPLLEGYFKLDFLYSDDGQNWTISGSVSPIGSVSNTTQTYPNNGITVGEYTGGGVEPTGPTIVSLTPDTINFSTNNKIFAGLYTDAHRYWKVAIDLDIDNTGPSQMKIYELEASSDICGNNVAPLATISAEWNGFDYTPYVSPLTDGFTDHDHGALTFYNSGSSMKSGSITLDFGPGNEVPVGEFRFFMGYSGNFGASAIANFTLYFSDTGSAGSWAVVGNATIET